MKKLAALFILLVIVISILARRSEILFFESAIPTDSLVNNVKVDPFEPEKIEPEPVISQDELEPESEQDPTSATEMGIGQSFDGAGTAIDGLSNLGSTSSSSGRSATVIKKTPPEYPSNARENQIEGFVILKLKINQSGELSDHQILQSEPKGYFEKAAVAAVQKWSFKPAVKGNSTVTGFITQTMRFKIDQ